MKAFTFFVGALLALVCIGSVLGFYGAWGQLPELASQFRLLYTWLLLIGLVYFFVRRNFRLCIVAVLFLAMNLSQILPFYIKQESEKPTGNKIRVMQFNTWGRNQHPERIEKLIENTSPDIIAFEELTAHNYDYLQRRDAFKKYHTYQYKKGRLAFLSRYPFIVEPEVTDSLPAIQAKILVGQQIVSVVVVHLGRPIGDYAIYQNQVKTLAALSKTKTTPLIVMGDLNTSPWSSSFDMLLDQAGLNNTQVAYGIQPTYPCYVPKTQWIFPFPFLPIDHILVNDKVDVINRQNGPLSGSDHYPVITNIVIKR